MAKAKKIGHLLVIVPVDMENMAVKFFWCKGILVSLVESTNFGLWMVLEKYVDEGFSDSAVSENTNALRQFDGVSFAKAMDGSC